MENEWETTSVTTNVKFGYKFKLKLEKSDWFQKQSEEIRKIVNPLTEKQ